MIVQDWRDAAPGYVQPLYEREQHHWLDAFSWDTRARWSEVEQARLTGTLPGLIAFDRTGRVQGWSFHLTGAGVVHIDTLVASSPAATAVLLNGVLEAAGDAEAVSCFIPTRAPLLADALERRGFAVEPYLYLVRDNTDAISDAVRPLDPSPDLSADLSRRSGEEAKAEARSAKAESVIVDQWQESDLRSAATLLRTAYGGVSSQHFAPGDTLAEWEQYARNLVQGNETFDRGTTCVARRREDSLAGLLLVSRIAGDTAHIAQLALAPSARGQGLAARLLDESCRRARAAGVTRMTLLVGASNHAARSLYKSRNFSERAMFIAARRVGTRDTAFGLFSAPEACMLS